MSKNKVKRIWTENIALKLLKSKRVNVDGKKITFSPHFQIGISSWGCLDYLKNNCGYRVIKSS